MSNDYQPSRIERLRVTLELAQIVVCIAIVVTLFVYPAALLRGDALRLREAAVGTVGLLIWAFVLGGLSQQFAG